MQHKKTFIIFSSTDHNWKSCSLIEKNLFSIYKNIFGSEAHFIDLNSPKWPETSSLDHSVQFIIITHKVNAAVFFELKNRGFLNPRVLIRWHVFGNFFNLFLLDPALEAYSKNFNIQLFAASKAFAKKIKIYLKKNNTPIFVVPFAIEDSLFKNSIEKKMRSKLKISANAKVICIAGRLSLQKNIFYMMSLFQKMAQKHKDLHLVICGTFDDIGIPEMGLSFVRNSFCAMNMKKMEAWDESIKNRVHLLGDLSQKDLAKVFQISNVYLNLSTYLLEDFGVAPIQALLCGTPAVLSSWGGFADNQLANHQAVSLIPLQLKKQALWIDEECAIKSIESYLVLKASFKAKLSQQTKALYSKKNIERKLRPIILNNGFKAYPFGGCKKNKINQLLPEKNKIIGKIKINKSLKAEAQSLIVKTGQLEKNLVSLTDSWNELLQKVRDSIETNALLNNQLDDLKWYQKTIYMDVLDVMSLQNLEGKQDNFLNNQIVCNDSPNVIAKFFKKNPKPKADGNLQFCIDLNLRDIIKIPKTWRSRVGFFSSEAINSNVKPRRKILVFAPTLKPAKNKELESICRKAQNKGAQVYLLNSKNETNAKIETRFKKWKIKLMPWGQFVNSRTFKEFDFIDLSTEANKSKSFFRDFVLDKGGRAYNKQTYSKAKLNLVRSFTASSNRKINIYYENG